MRALAADKQKMAVSISNDIIINSGKRLNTVSLISWEDQTNEIADFHFEIADFHFEIMIFPYILLTNWNYQAL